MSLLDDLPTPSEKRLAVRLTAPALRHVRSGHPWIYDKSITKGGRAASGDLAVVFDEQRRFNAIGLWDPDSPIRIKVLHQGSPRSIDATFWTKQIEAAKAIRMPIRRDSATTAYREINGENDGFPGLIVDRYANVGVLKLYTAAWFPHLRVLVPELRRLLGLDSIVLRLGRNVQDDNPPIADGTTIIGNAPDGPVEFLEGDLRFEANVVDGQKTGHFLDQRDNRIEVGRLARRKRVLDVFSCTGGFTTHAAANGAKAVTSIDLAPKAIEATARHLAMNPTAKKVPHVGIVGDAFAEMEKLSRAQEEFDLIIVDPPSFAQRQSNVDAASRSYARLTRLAIDLAAPNATLVQASCSSRITPEDFDAIVLGAADGRLEVTRRTGHAVDHPVTFPEGRYLKAIFGRIR